MTKPLPMTVLGGYLGAGKTTLLNHIIRNTTEAIGIIVNDFGDVVIDEDLIEGHDGETMALANGCICCSMIDGLVGALEQMLASDPRPERLVIEASGVADPSKIAAHGYTPGLQLDGVIVVADVETIRKRASDKWVSDTVKVQLASADIIAITKTDLVSWEEADAVRTWLATLNPTAGIVEARYGRVPLEVVFGINSAAAPSGRVSSASVESGSPPFISHTVDVSPMTSHADLEAAIAALPAEVVRAKGVVDIAGQLVSVQKVGARCSIEPFDGVANAPNRLIIIGTPDLDVSSLLFGP